MTLNMNNGHAIFFQIKELSTGANLCKYLKQLFIENDNRAIAMMIFL